MPRKTIVHAMMEREAKDAKLARKIRSSATPPKKKRKIISFDKATSIEKTTPSTDAEKGIVISEYTIPTPLVNPSNGVGDGTEQGKG